MNLFHPVCFFICASLFLDCIGFLFEFCLNILSMNEVIRRYFSIYSFYFSRWLVFPVLIVLIEWPGTSTKSFLSGTWLSSTTLMLLFSCLSCWSECYESVMLQWAIDFFWLQLFPYLVSSDTVSNTASSTATFLPALFKLLFFYISLFSRDRSF